MFNSSSGDLFYNPDGVTDGLIKKLVLLKQNNIAINALNLEQSLKRSNRQKSNRAAMDNNYMLTILAACLSYNHNDASKACCQ